MFRRGERILIENNKRMWKFVIDANGGVEKAMETAVSRGWKVIRAHDDDAKFTVVRRRGQEGEFDVPLPYPEYFDTEYDALRFLQKNKLVEIIPQTSPSKDEIIFIGSDESKYKKYFLNILSIGGIYPSLHIFWMDIISFEMFIVLFFMYLLAFIFDNKFKFIMIFAHYFILLIHISSVFEELMLLLGF